ncbi:hypothetical protein A2Z00_03635 [Candidatus Gottesmanbacteria bacterium RBG_13_45_10]|uniref:Uncharacterized protein n=1 Tax=Candidatus Gottesmanbacteria bacterium RBG_13_45_10 TaxID=1798370 RepID=A0A1F5ZGS1_9BACT|nr:MAG: hypothetical protein A2Z00_03635 [Candidatus Gottesmanbacteria bacterium RBG_13_45_10]
MSGLEAKLFSPESIQRLEFDQLRTKSGSKGFGVVSLDDPHWKQHLFMRLERKLTGEVLSDVREQEDIVWHTMGGFRIAFPLYSTGLYPKIHVAVARPLRGPEAKPTVLFLTKHRQHVLQFLVDRHGYLDPSSWRFAGHTPIQIPKAVKQLNKLFNQLHPDKPFLDGIFPAGYAVDGDIRRRHTVLVQWVRRNFRIMRELHAGETVQARELFSSFHEPIIVITIATEELFALLRQTPVRIGRARHLLVAARSESLYKIMGSDKEVIIAEITDNERDLLSLFEKSLTYPLGHLDRKTRDAYRKNFGLLLNRLQRLGYRFRKGTGIASREKLVFPVVMYYEETAE